MSDKKNFKLDEIDRLILEKLQADAQITNAQLAKEIGLSPAPTLERVKKLENAGIIQSYHAVLDPQRVGLGVTTYVQVSLISHKKSVIESFIKKINVIENVIECHHMTGASDFLLKIVAKDIPAYQKLMLDQISEIEEIEQTQSMIVLSTFKRNPVLPINS
ncbi:MAG: Lrp/AsnC family transcriptional regulator, partial [Thermonemataceae bacterium]|nr:Lrp/AsnC family transcriptional regulator [Thermonemataceae bacterium]